MPIAFKNEVLALFREIKKTPRYAPIPIWADSRLVGYLQPINYTSLNNSQHIELLTGWRKANQKWFPSNFKLSPQRTKQWLKKQLIEKPDRILFWVITKDNPPKIIGHLGLNRFDWKNKICQIDNVIRGEKSTTKGLITFALKTLIEWSFAELKLTNLTLTTFADNRRAIDLYQRCGFKTYKKIPLHKVKTTRQEAWRPIKDDKKAERFNLEMILK